MRSRRIPLRNWRWAGLLATISVAVLLAGCAPEPRREVRGGSAAARNAAPSPPVEIAVVPKSAPDEYREALRAGTAKAQFDLARQGIKTVILWKDGTGDRHVGSQGELLEACIHQKVRGIVLAPDDRSSPVAPLRDAARLRIPVVFVGSPLPDHDAAIRVLPNDTKAGEAAGKQIVNLLQGKGQVALLHPAHAITSAASATARESGFLTAVRTSPAIKAVSFDSVAGISKALKTPSAAPLDGIYCENEADTRAVHQILKAADLPHRIDLVGFGSAPDLIQHLRTHEISALVVPNGFNMGYLAVKTTMDAIQGRPVAGAVDSGVILLTPDNLDAPENQQYLSPPAKQNP